MCYVDASFRRGCLRPFNQHLREPRLIDVVKAAAQTAKWDAWPSPKPEERRSEIANGRGIACVACEGGMGYAALSAEVEVDPASGPVQAKRFMAAHDCGPISNPHRTAQSNRGRHLAGYESRSQ